ncbi:MAG TPA: glycosyltransferase [Candidatus Eisenbacteria bacterium]|nr:glycosyltransferase [Candidatus Eisenbacteria bacterium]
MNLVVFGLTISSSWGNGHATLWRGLCRALDAQGHAVEFLERDTPYYGEHRDLPHPPGASLTLYDSWDSVRDRAVESLRTADVAVVTSYCPDAIEAAALMGQAPRSVSRVFYDLDAPVTLERIRTGLPVAYIPSEGLAAFDLVLSYAGGPAMEEIRERLGARRVAPLYGCVDPCVHRPARRDPRLEGDLSYLGTYSEDRQEALERLFLEPARRLPECRFVLGGSQYPAEFPWLPNIRYVRHVPPPQHAAFYSSSRFTLNVTRGPMLAAGHCPSGRLFEAAACGTAILTDRWSGLEEFFTPGTEIVLADGPEDVARALRMSPAESDAIGDAARRRALAQHTADRRASELVSLLESAGAVAGEGGA